MKANIDDRTKRMVQLALFSAVIVLMAFTPLGYIKTLGLSITLLVVPVSVGAILLGPMAGAILGGVFGITSFIQCFGFEAFGTMLLGINPIATFLLCMIPRILMGWLTGLVFLGLKKVDHTRSKGVSFTIASLAGPLLNTILFMTLFVVFFYNTGEIQKLIADNFQTKNVLSFLIAFVGINGLVEAGIGFVLGTAISKSLDVIIKKSGN